MTTPSGTMPMSVLQTNALSDDTKRRTARTHQDIVRHHLPLPLFPAVDSVSAAAHFRNRNDVPAPPFNNHPELRVDAAEDRRGFLVIGEGRDVLDPDLPIDLGGRAAVDVRIGRGRGGNVVQRPKRGAEIALSAVAAGRRHVGHDRSKRWSTKQRPRSSPTNSPGSSSADLARRNAAGVQLPVDSSVPPLRGGGPTDWGVRGDLAVDGKDAWRVCFCFLFVVFQLLFVGGEGKPASAPLTFHSG